MSLGTPGHRLGLLGLPCSASQPLSRGSIINPQDDAERSTECLLGKQLELRARKNDNLKPSAPHPARHPLPLQVRSP